MHLLTLRSQLYFVHSKASPPNDPLPHTEPERDWLVLALPTKTES